MKLLLTYALAGAMMAFALAAVADSDIVGVIKRSKGPVLIERSGVQAASAAGAELRKGDRVVTGANGYVEMRLHGVAPISVGPNASVAVDRFIADENYPRSSSVPPLLQGLASLMAGLNRHR